uniref:Uncharacterized protein n=1 Tax=Panagrolaimus sp. PS1159 TaxID=55785 RepID=A0AC35FFJ7_9BILA
MGQKAEEEKISLSIRCSLNSIKNGQEIHTCSATAPNCEIPVITEGQVFGIFMIAIILPSLPLWISAVCFFSGFCDHGLKNVRKVRTHLNPFIRESHLQREHLNNNGREMDTFLERQNNERRQLKEDFERHSQITEAQSGISAPARLENIPTTNRSNEKSANVGASNTSGSVHSEPLPILREPRKLDLNQKRLQHKKEKIQFLEHQKSQRKKLFEIPQSSQQQKQPQQQPQQQIPQPFQPQPPQPQQQPIIPSLESINNLFGFPSYENLGSQSSFNMTSVSQQLPFYPPPVNMELITKVQELTAQNNQLMGNNFKALDTITQLVESFNLMAYSIKFWSGNIAQQIPPPPLPQHSSSESQKEPPIAKIPVKKPSNGSNCSNISSSNGINGIVPKFNQQKQQKQQQKFNGIPKIKIENVQLSRKEISPQIRNGPIKPEKIAPIIDDISDNDDGGGGDDNLLFLPNPPPEIYQQWHILQQQYNQNEQDHIQMSDEEIEDNLLFRIVSHCGTFLPPWLFRNFRDSVAEFFDEFYMEDEDRSETLNSLKLFPDTEPMEAAVEKKLYNYIWPLICKAIRKTSQEMHLNFDIFGTEKSDWIVTDVELQHFRALMENDDEDDDLSSASSEDEEDNVNELVLQQPTTTTAANQQQQQRRQPPDLQALAQERIDEVSEEEY